MGEYMALVMFAGVCVVLMLGYPVAFTLGGTALGFAALGVAMDAFDTAFLQALPNRIFGIMGNETLVAVPLFVMMGVMLERAKIAENLLDAMAKLFGTLRGGLGISVVLVGALLAASTGIVGATVVTMGLLSLPTMLRRNYDPGVAAGTICAAGTLGQIIPPSIILVLLGDVLASAYQQAQLAQGVFSPESLTVGDLFAGAIIPGLILVGLFVLYLLWLAIFHGDRVPAVIDVAERNYSKRDIFVKLLRGLVAPLALICAVLGSILGGIATPTEAASVGAMGAMLLAAVERQLSVSTLADVVRRTTLMTSMVFMILFGAALFSLVFRGFGGDELVKKLLTNLPGGAFGAILVVMLIMFVLGFVLDFIEIIFVVVPIVGPVLLAMDINPIWLGVMMAVNLQTSFLTPPFGFALFYLRGVAPPELTTGQIYRGVIPFIVLQLIGLCIIAAWPGLVTWLPKVMSAG